MLSTFRSASSHRAAAKSARSLWHAAEAFTSALQSRAGLDQGGSSFGAPALHFHSEPNAVQANAAPAAAAEATSIPFPREGPGVVYALNWALAAAGVTPAGEVFRPKRQAELAALAKGSAVKATSGSKVLVQGSGGDTALSPQLFKRALREVTALLSSSHPIYVHDGAVGSSSSCDARTRVIGETPGAAAAVARILTPTPTNKVAQSTFPLTVYAVPSYKSEALGSSFIAADLSSSLIIAAGSAVGDTAALKSILAAAASAHALQRGAVQLPGRLIAGSASAQPFLLLAPSSAGDPLLAKAAAWPDLGLVWAATGVARLFATTAANAPNLYPQPTAVVLLTSDSTGALPPTLKLTPEQAGFYFLVGYDGAGFHPAFARSPYALGATDRLALAQAFSALVASTNTPAFLVNAHGAADIPKLVASSVSGSTPAADAAPEATAALKTKLEEFAKSKFPNIPEGMKP